jgi:hypothetical protein
MIPFYKAFSLILRVLSRPILNHTKKVHSSGEAQSMQMRRFFILMGNFYHRYDSAINRRFLKVESSFAHKPLSEELALEKGIEFTYEILFYCIVIGLPFYEIWRAAEESAEKSAEIDRKLTRLEESSTSALGKLEEASRELFGRSDLV